MRMAATGHGAGPAVLHDVHFPHHSTVGAYLLRADKHSVRNPHHLRITCKSWPPRLDLMD